MAERAGGGKGGDGSVTQPRYIGVTPDGEVLLPAPAEVVWDAGEDAPADSFSGVFPLEKSFGDLTGVKVLGGDELLFDGVTDIQRETSAAGGRVLKLAARSRAGLLLDSEAVPQIYSYPSLPMIYARHVAPYGFSGWQGGDRVFEGTMQVAKGMSEWQAAALFCAAFLRIAPRVRGSVFDASGQIPQEELRFGGAGLRYLSAEVKNRFCDRYSEVLAPAPSGGTYVSAAEDAGTQALGIRRRRCLKSADGAGALLSSADRKAFAATVECPGRVQAEIGAPAVFCGGVLGTFGGLTVAGVRYLLDASGERTRIVLRRQGACGFRSR